MLPLFGRYEFNVFFVRMLPDEANVGVIAFYLPQLHPILKKDEW